MRKSALRYWIGSLFFLLVWAIPLFAGDWKSAVVLNEKGQVVYSYKARRRLPPASTVKVLSAMVVIDHLPLDRWVRVSKVAEAVEPSKVYLKAGEHYRVKDLLYAMLMASANDASVVLAEAVAGTQKRFANLMNTKAKRCGARESHFLTPNGLPAPGQYSTALDLAKIMRIASRYGLIVSALSRKYYRFRSKGGREIRVVNHNKLLWAKRWSWIKGKTGFTRRAGQCFLGMFQRRGRRYFFAMLGGRTLWSNVKELARKVR